MSEVRTYPEEALVNSDEKKDFKFDTKARPEYVGWQMSEACRDLYQNHLDACSEIYYLKLLNEVFDVEKLKNLDQDTIFKVHDFAFKLFYYHRFLRSQPYESKDHFFSWADEGVAQYCKKDVLDENGFSLDKFLEKTNNIREDRPKVSIAMREFDGGRIVWVDSGEAVDYYRGERGYQPVQVEISDTGSGYDPKLLAQFESFKPFLHQRGKFGEGGKLSNFAMMQKGYTVVNSSQYDYHGSDQRWYARPVVSDKNTVEVVGHRKDAADARLQRNGVSRPHAGSSTRIIFPQIKSEDRGKVNKERSERNGMVDKLFNQTPDPVYVRDRDRFVYSQDVYIGVSVDCPGEVYMQDLYVCADANADFGYNLWNKNLINERDRKYINLHEYDIYEEIKLFWLNCKDEELLNKLVDLVFEKSATSHCLEMQIFYDFLYQYSVDDEYNEKLLEIFADRFAYRFYLNPNYDYVLMSGYDAFGAGVIQSKGYEILDVGQFGSYTDSIVRLLTGKYTIFTKEDLDLLDANPFKGIEKETSEVAMMRGVVKDLMRIILADDELREYFGYFLQKDITKYFVFGDDEVSINEVEIYAGTIRFDPYIFDRYTLDEIKGLVLIAALGEGVGQKVKGQQIFQQYLELVCRKLNLNVDVANVFDPRIDQKPQDLFKPLDVEKIKHEANFDRLFSKLHKYTLSSSELESVLAEYRYMKDALDDKLQQEFEFYLQDLWLIEGDVLISIDGDMGVKREPLVQYYVGQTHERRDLYRKNDKYFCPAPMNEGQLYIRQNEKFFISNGTVYGVGDGKEIFPVDTAVFSNNTSFRNGVEYSQFMEGFTKLHQHRKNLQEISELPTELASSISMKFASGIWSESQRLSLDLRQNHERQGKVKLQFLDSNGDWIENAGGLDLSKQKYYGIRWSDQGAGYAPDILNILGDTDTVDPRLPGQFGEGMKKAAVGSLKLGWLKLAYKSRCKVGEEIVDWQATPEAVTTEEASVPSRTGLGGKERVKFENLGFKIDRREDEGFVSATELLLVGGEESNYYSKWESFLISANSRSLVWQQHAGDNAVRSGNVEIAKGRGYVYENGLKILKESLGRGIDINTYDIGVNRERTTYNEDKLNDRIVDAIVQANDVGFIDMMLDQVIKDPAPMGDIIQRLAYEEIKYPNLWRDSFARKFPGKAIFCVDYKTSGFQADYIKQLNYWGQLGGFIKITDVVLYEGLRKLVPTIEEVAYDQTDLVVTSSQPQERKNYTEKLIRQIAKTMVDWIGVQKEGAVFKNKSKMIGVLVKWATDSNIAERIVYYGDKYFGEGESYGIQMGFSERLYKDGKGLAGVIAHELIHQMSSELDYTDNFMVMLKSFADYVRRNPAI